MVEIVFRNHSDDEIQLTGIMENVFSENKAEFILIKNTNIRLDKIIQISEL